MSASNVRCGGISFKLVMFSVCRPSLVTIGAAVGAATASQADSHTHAHTHAHTHTHTHRRTYDDFALYIQMQLWA